MGLGSVELDAVNKDRWSVPNTQRLYIHGVVVYGMLYGNLGPFTLLQRRRGRAWAIAYGLKYFSCETCFEQS